MELMIFLLVLMVLVTLWSVMTSLLLRAAIALALTSAILSIIMFRLGAPLAAAFELSVCSGLISVVFISVISLTHRLPLKEYLRRRQNRINRFRYLPVILIVVGLGFIFLKLPINLVLPNLPKVNDVQVVMWELRRLDLFGQIMLLLAGVYGVLILFKGNE